MDVKSDNFDAFTQTAAFSDLKSSQWNKVFTPSTTTVDPDSTSTYDYRYVNVPEFHGFYENNYYTHNAFSGVIYRDGPQNRGSRSAHTETFITEPSGFRSLYVDRYNTIRGFMRSEASRNGGENYVQSLVNNVMSGVGVVLTPYMQRMYENEIVTQIMDYWFDQKGAVKRADGHPRTGERPSVPREKDFTYVKPRTIRTRKRPRKRWQRRF